MLIMMPDMLKTINSLVKFDVIGIIKINAGTVISVMHEQRIASCSVMMLSASRYTHFVHFQKV